MESLRRAVRATLADARPVAVRLPRESKVPPRVWGNGRCSGGLQVDLLAEHWGKPGLLPGNYIPRIHPSFLFKLLSMCT